MPGLALLGISICPADIHGGYRRRPRAIFWVVALQYTPLTTFWGIICRLSPLLDLFNHLLIIMLQINTISLSGRTIGLAKLTTV